MSDLHDKIFNLKKNFDLDITNIKNSKELEELRVKYLGKKSIIQSLMKVLKSSSSVDKPIHGKIINQTKKEISDCIDDKYQQLQKEELDIRIVKEQIDVTLPGRPLFMGRKHPISKIIDEVCDVLIGMGFSVQSSPEIESDYYNYGGLNYSIDHPARDMQDTIYITKDLLLRSHTSSIQQRIMEKSTPPIRIISVGKCYRNESVTSSSHVFFHQIDALYIDLEVTFSDLIATLEEFYTKLFKNKVEFRVRPSYFPFVEPGMELDLKCTFCNGNGCQVCKYSGWLELCGAGMVHPEVLKNGDVNPYKYSGYAFGGGIERIAMLLYGINDIRFFFENDMNFLSQFPY